VDKDEALKMALEAFKWNYNTDLDNIPACEKWAKMLKENIAAIKEALAQPEQIVPSDYSNSHQPKWVAFRNKQTGEFCTGGFLRGQLWQWTPLYDHPYELVCVCGAAWEGDTMVETPRKRTWVGLTEEEMHKCWGDPLTPLGMKHARAIEAKLREKNT
jgi:hypothetical protein